MKKLLLPLLFFTACHLNAAGRHPLDEYAGRYTFPEGVMVKEVMVSVENGALVLVSPLCTTILVKDGEDNFSIPSFKGTAVFKRDANKKVTSLTIAMQQLKLDGIRDANEVTVPAPEPVPIIIIWESKFLNAV